MGLGKIAHLDNFHGGIKMRTYSLIVGAAQ